MSYLSYAEPVQFSPLQAQSVQSVERFFKSAIVDRNSFIASAALVSAYHLHPISRDVIRRWANETQEAINAKAVTSTSFPALGGSYFSGGSGSGGQGGGYQAVPSSSFIMQYHALGLLYLIREKDRMAITKMIQQFGGKPGASTIRNHMGICMLIRYAAKVMEEDPK